MQRYNSVTFGGLNRTNDLTFSPLIRSSPLRRAMKNRFLDLDAHTRLFIALVVSLIVFVLTIGHMDFAVQAIAIWNVFAWTVIVLAWSRILLASPKTSVQTAKLQDSARFAIFLFVIFAAVASLASVAILIGGAKGLGKKALTEHLLLAGTTVVSSWFLIHTVFAMHYAHGYYRDEDEGPGFESAGGLEFPNEKEPDFLDFAYFSFVIGMTCQVSDVQVSSRGMRRLALVHGLLSFVFNTVILALSINLASGLL
jgi:uncharacterized membrane protein